MKKLNFAILGALLAINLTTRAFAETTISWTKAGCESVKGTWITAHLPDDDGCDTAHCNGRNFCKSGKPMNYWSALIWCKSIGHQLADLETACPNGLSSGDTCANLIKGNSLDYWLWINMPRGTKQALGLGFTRGGFHDFDRIYSTNTHALCME